jgi:hypothetical protein
MNIEELTPLTNGLSVAAGAQTLVCERAMIRPASKEAVDLAFWIAGTNYRPRLRLTRDRVTRSSPTELARLLSRVVVNAVTGQRRP